MIWRITVGSLRNKLLFLLPAALALSLVAPWAITPLLMIGGAYLCYEGAEKVFEAVFPHAAHGHEDKIGAAPRDPQELEAQKVSGAIRTDFILSAEIMAIALASIPDVGFWGQAVVLAVVGIGVTALVYGTVAVIVKADDVGLALATSEGTSVLGSLSRGTGRALVKGMPVFLKLLAIVGTAAMVWVGGGILVHGLAVFGLEAIEHAIHDAGVAAAGLVPAAPGVAAFLIGALGSGVVGLTAGALVIPLVHFVLTPVYHRAAALFR